MSSCMYCENALHPTELCPIDNFPALVTVSSKFSKPSKPSKESIPKKSSQFQSVLNMFSNPFHFIDNTEQYSVTNIFRPLFGQKTTYTGSFPNDIKNFIWCQEGVNDDKPWLLLCQLESGLYAYFQASCDYTGFDCQGGMSLYVDESVDTLVEMAMDTDDRELYVKFLSHRKSCKAPLKLGDFL